MKALMDPFFQQTLVFIKQNHHCLKEFLNVSIVFANVMSFKLQVSYDEKKNIRMLAINIYFLSRAV